MERDDILVKLRDHRPQIQALGVRSLKVFGSVARGEITPESDVDLLIELDPPLTYARYTKAKFYLEDLLGRDVDLVFAEKLKPSIRSSVEQEAILVA